jgi:hypothetical protein
LSKSADLPRRLGDILTPALGKLAVSDEARAYAAWARAVGEPVTKGSRPRAFRRGQLTVECASSVWANELTYLGPQILRRMDEVAPGHPVERFRFIVGRLQASEADPPGDPSEDPREATDGASVKDVQAVAAATAGRDSGASAAEGDHRHRPPVPDAHQAVRDRAEGVEDVRLRAAIEAALRRSSEEPSGPPETDTSSG